MASILPNMSENNISFSTIPIAWLLCLSPRIYARLTYRFKTGKDIDMRHPRTFAKTVTDDNAVDAETRGRSK
jgi:hypothetical protein